MFLMAYMYGSQGKLGRTYIHSVTVTDPSCTGALK